MQASVEMFVDGGRRVLTEILFPTEPFARASLFAFGGGAVMNEGIVHSLSNSELARCTQS